MITIRIYIAGPYSADHPRKVLENVNRAIDMGIELMKKGHAVYIPHFTHYMHLRPQCPFEYEEYVRQDKEWVKASDALFYLAPSPGADGERDLAVSLGKEIFHHLWEVPDIS